MRFIIVFAVLLMTAPSFAQTKIAGVVMPNVIKAGDEYLKINGGGLREKFFIDLYVAALYLQEKSSSGSSIVSADKPMAVKLRVVSGMVDNDNFEEALREGFEKSCNGNTAPVQAEIDKIIDVGFKEDIKTGDVYDLIYLPNEGTSLYRNNKLQVTIPGMDFKKALWGIWLGSDPVDSSLKKDLLGN